SMRVCCFPSGSTTPEPLWLVGRGPGFKDADLELADVFPNGCYSVRIRKMPGTQYRFRDGWRIYFNTGRYSAPVNQCVWSRFEIEWRGNIVMVKHARRSNVILPVDEAEDLVADVVLAQLVIRSFWSRVVLTP
ncbi:hypothetical protein C8R47DRAFT_970060, partial [Mycena vitilis]